MRRVVPLLAALALLAGCSQSTDGSANPGGATPTTTTAADGPTSTKPTATSEERAKRPKTINIGDVDPCTLLTGPQRSEFGLDRPPQQGGAPDKESCTMSREDRKYFVALVTDSTAGIDDYAKSKGKVTKLEVGGFPALLVESTTDLGVTCSVPVDVSDGQVVDVRASSVGETDMPALCQIVQPVAAAVVTTLNE
ncbi:uncharacterized protein DUF3558 [Saccharothrix saharensis]|uniref:Uncharacterized protein DUF3558 n=1 Tax=Saccharothrix saharensis TaxID=571190 RepID=A0A543JH80_9PSEU|nr:DUF3558 domain-containing protein [Saccharothrix saharensis]TQM82198.1 uncharacterized protein DUF3558 [Saccharothrix saharensis]